MMGGNGQNGQGTKSSEDVLKEIVMDNKVFDIWKELVGADNSKTIKDIIDDPFFPIVYAQYKLYKDKGLDPKDEGYQVGEPWGGDLENAKVLFLGTNPAITLTSDCPRRHEDGTFTWYKKSFEGRFKDQWKKQNELIHELSGEKLTKEEEILKRITYFHKERFQNAPFNRNYLFSLYMLQNNEEIEKSGGVRYWNNMYKIINDLARADDPRKVEKSKKSLMKLVACAEIVQFKSSHSEGVDELIDYCWEKYTRHIIENCGAEVIFLVGSKARDTFIKKYEGFNASDKKELKKESFNECKNKKIVCIPHISGTNLKEDKFIPSKCLKICYKELQDAIF
jgi:hypothetical protein